MARKIPVEGPLRSPIAPFTQLGENPGADQLLLNHLLDVISKRLQSGIRLGRTGRVIGSGTVTQVPAYRIT